MMAKPRVWGLFEGVGVELEYMIVDASSLDVKPCADRLLEVVGGGHEQEVDRGPALWSNELALHVIEMKSNGPAPSLPQLVDVFAQQVRDLTDLLVPAGAVLLPTAMHPWMDPERELLLWPHADSEIYQSFDRIFGCRGHGFANLQSMHLNLPFASDDEFRRLHEAIRVVLPLIPGLAASSPLVEGALTATLDSRLEAYRTNCARVPSVTGLVVPESVASMREYQEQILGRIYSDLKPLDPTGVLRYEWVNARGAIARFDRMAIEIRTIDVQECPRADLALAELVVQAVRALTEQRHVAVAELAALATEDLAGFHQATVVAGEAADWPRADYLRAFGIEEARLSVGELWTALSERLLTHGPETRERDAALSVIQSQGTLASRIVRSLKGQVQRERIREVYRELTSCLVQGRMFEASKL